MIRKTLLATALLGTLFSATSMAATDGALSPFETTGEMQVAATVQSIISITHVDDVSFGALGPGSNVFAGETYTQTENICVYTNANSFDLQISSSAGGDNGFASEGLGHFENLHYTLDIRRGVWEEGPATFSYYDYAIDVQQNETIQGLNYDTDHYNDTDCNSSTTLQENVQLAFTLNGDDLVDATPDTYWGTVTIIARTSTGEIGG
jgi:hypothetical protein